MTAMMIITVDGPSASGKGTLAKKLSRHYNLAFLDTGELYRAVAAVMLAKQMDLQDDIAAAQIAASIDQHNFHDYDLRDEAVAQGASKVAVYAGVRTALLNVQRDFAINPPSGYKGAVLDGRDIGTRICPSAPYKFFVTADIEVRAQRRCKELQERRIKSIYNDVLQDMIQRDQRDQQRTDWPARPADDAIVIDTTHCTAEQALEFAVHCIDIKAAM